MPPNKVISKSVTAGKPYWVYEMNPFLVFKVSNFGFYHRHFLGNQVKRCLFIARFTIPRAFSKVIRVFPHILLSLYLQW